MIKGDTSKEDKNKQRNKKKKGKRKKNKKKKGEAIKDKHDGQDDIVSDAEKIEEKSKTNYIIDCPLMKKIKKTKVKKKKTRKRKKKVKIKKYHLHIKRVSKKRLK